MELRFIWRAIKHMKLLFTSSIDEVKLLITSSVTYIESLVNKSYQAYNRFFKKYKEKEMSIKSLQLDCCDDYIFGGNTSDPKFKVPMIEYLPYVSYPLNEIRSFKSTGLLSFCESKVPIEEFKEINFTFRYLHLSIENAKLIYDYRVKFSEEVSSKCKELSISFRDEEITCSVDTVNKVVDFLLSTFPKVKTIQFEGDAVSTQRFCDYSCNIINKEPKDFFKIIWIRDMCTEAEIDNDSYIFSEDILFENSSELNLKDIEFGIFSDDGKTSIVAKAKRFRVQFYNNKWEQMENYLFIKNFYTFEVDKVSFTENDQLCKAFKTYKSNSKIFNSKSFVMILKLKINLIPTEDSKLWSYENRINYQGHVVELHFRGEDSSIPDLCDSLKTINPSQSVDFFCYSPLDFSTENGKILIEAFMNIRIGRLSAGKFFQSDEGISNLSNLFSLKGSKINSIILKLNSESQLLTILDSLKCNMLIDYMDLKTKDLISDEIEKKAIKFIDDRIGCIFELKSNHKSLRTMDERRVIKFYTL